MPKKKTAAKSDAEPLEDLVVQLAALQPELELARRTYQRAGRLKDKIAKLCRCRTKPIEREVAGHVLSIKPLAGHWVPNKAFEVELKPVPAEVAK